MPRNSLNRRPLSFCKLAPLSNRSLIKPKYDGRFRARRQIEYETEFVPGIVNMSKTENRQAIRILYVEDDHYDRQLVARALLEDDLCCEFAYATTEIDFKEALERVTFDVILSDFTLPGFSGTAALAVARATRPEVPFLFVSGTIGEERAVETLKSGAKDYVCKDHLVRLTGAIRRALRESEQIAERKHAEEALRASEERFRELAETIQEVFWVTDPSKSRMLYISPAYEKIWRRTCQSLYDEPASWLDAIHPDDRPRVLRSARTKQASGAYDEEYRILRPDGQERWIRDRAFPVQSPSGEVQRIVGLARDITERRQLEEQLRQSQKMEAIGQLAGGVAHDFNNVLTAIMIQAEVAGLTENLPEAVREALQQICIYGKRAANLTRQLLVFSRRQVMQQKEVNLNEIVASLAKMLQRIIGEDVRLQQHLQPIPLIIRADAGMLEQVVLNLVINARDAMPQGGRLLIETAEKSIDEAFARLHPEAVPGRYVWLSVSDTGSGIAPEVLPRIFEPFFTTKEPGKGTGLGLATVYGIVKQHGGWIQVFSEPQHGATFQIFLPASGAASVSVGDTEHANAEPRGGTETILLVEDEASVRMVTRMLLEEYGYRVLEASNGLEALKLWEQEGSSIALLVTDLVMPAGVSGQQLASRLKEYRPDLKIIFTSGYSAEIAGRQIQLQHAENFLQKPFSANQLLHLIRHSLDEA